jgi:competence protein ComEC
MPHSLVQAFSDRLDRDRLTAWHGVGLRQPIALSIWAPVAFGAGSILYFSLAHEPPVSLGLTALAMAILVGLWSLRQHRGRPTAWSICLLLVLAAIGFARAQLHTQGQASAMVDDSERAQSVIGWIEAIETRNGRERFVVRVHRLDDMDRPPRRLRFYGQRGQWQPGDGVQARVVLTPPRRPAAPGGYDPAFAAWFSGLGGTGYAIAPLAAADVPGDRLQRQLARWRWQLAEHVRTRAPPATAGIAAALLTGDRSGIPDHQAEALRAAGLGHILAISGLHMSLFAGGLYFAVRLALAAWPAYARRRDPRIPAALIALAGAAVYLVLSGLSVSTQRAFVMVAVILLGVIFQRRAISMQSIALAAMIILGLQPQSILSPGFQMSFAAAAALVAAFNIWRRWRRQGEGGRGWWRSLTQFWGSLSVSSLVAGSATAAFAAFHFNRIAVFGFLANLAAMPVFSLVVMPAGAVALALEPIGLDGPALAIMGWGLVWVVRVAEFVSSWPGALAPVTAAPGAAVSLYALGFVLLVAASGLARQLGVALIAMAYVAWWNSPPADLFVSEDGVLLARTDSGWTSSDRRRARFATRVFLEQAGERTRPGRDGWRCDDGGCTLHVQGIRLAILHSGETLAEACDRSDLVLLQAPASPVQRAACAARLIDESDLARSGAMSFWLADGQILRSTSVEQARGDRLWARQARSARRNR